MQCSNHEKRPSLADKPVEHKELLELGPLGPGAPSVGALLKGIGTKGAPNKYPHDIIGVYGVDY